MTPETNRANILHFKTKQNYYVYDAPTNEILQLSKDCWELMQKPEFFSETINYSENAYKSIIEEFRLSKFEGLFSAKKPKKLSALINKDDLRETLNSKITQLILGVTERCNLRCKYCIYSGHYTDQRTYSNLDMDEKTAHQAIDFFLNSNKNSDKCCISFYGGEPTLNLPVIKSAVKYAEGKKKRDVLYSLTTNGFDLSIETIKFLIDNKFSILISLDGPQKKNDIYRRTINQEGTFHEICNTIRNICNIDEEYLKSKVRLSIVIGPPYNIRELKDFFDNNPLFKDMNFRTSYIASDSFSFFNSKEVIETKKEFVPEQDSLGFMYKEYKKNLINGLPYQSSFLRALFESSFVKLHKRNLYSGYSDKINMNGCCIPGARRMFVKPSGKISICERVNSTIEIGDIFQGFDYEKIEQIINTYISGSNENCLNCVANRICSACFATNFSFNGFYTAYKEKFCQNTVNGLINNLVDYCEILEKNPSAFDYMKEIFIS